MPDDRSRLAIRVPYAARLQVRGACGSFDATGVDVSTTGLRLALAQESLRLEARPDLTSAAAGVQTRVGSRFTIDLGLGASGGGRVRKAVGLVRLVVEDGRLELGCRFDAPLTAAESRELGITWPQEAGADEGRVREAAAWSDDGRATLDPSLAEEKIERLLDVPLAAPPSRDGTRLARRLTVLLRPRAGAGGAPLVGRAEALGESTLRMVVPEASVRALGAEPGDFQALLGALEEGHGRWPAMELLDGTRRLWHGVVRACGLEVDECVGGGAVVRFALGRRLLPAELARLCGGAAA